MRLPSTCTAPRTGGGKTNATTAGGEGSTHDAIPVGQFYTGAMQYLFFVMDHDRGAQNGESRFSNIQIYEN